MTGKATGGPRQGRMDQCGQWANACWSGVGACGFTHRRITSVAAEGFNSVIQAIKANARGFRSFENFSVRILFFQSVFNPTEIHEEPKNSTRSVHMTGTSTTTFPRLRLLGALALCVLCAAGCKPATPEEQIASYNKRLGSEGELTATHLIVRWIKGGGPPVTLNVPRQYLVDPPLARDDDGGLRWLYIDFALPGVTPWEPMPHALREDPPEKAKAWEKHFRARVLVFLDRDSGTRNYAVRASLHREGQEKSQYWPDHPVAGLDRYSRLHCDASGAPADKEFIREREADDPSPPNCRVIRHQAILVSPPEVKGDDEGVYVQCMSTACNAYFTAGCRGAHVIIRHEDLLRWKEIVEPASQLINSFVVDRPNGCAVAVRP